MKPRLVALAMTLAVALAGGYLVRDWLLRSMMYFPQRGISATPESAGLPFEDLRFATEDGETLHGFWVPAPRQPSVGHLLYCHGNGGNVSIRIHKVKLLAERGFDVLAFDYRGYGASTGAPGEEGTYRDARAARREMLARGGVDPARVLYLGESLGGAVALHLALQSPPAGLVLQSTFTSVRDMALVHYPALPRLVVPDAYPSLSRVGRLACPLLVIHGDADEIVPFAQGETLFRAAPEPKTFRRLPGIGHNDVVMRAGEAFGGALEEWARSLRGGGA